MAPSGQDVASVGYDCTLRWSHEQDAQDRPKRVDRSGGRGVLGLPPISRYRACAQGVDMQLPRELTAVRELFCPWKSAGEPWHPAVN
jgi:hypothetical protein